MKVASLVYFFHALTPCPSPDRCAVPGEGRNLLELNQG